MQALTIGHLAKESGVNLETVRYYERRGLLPKPPRNASGYRLFPAEATRRLRFIQRAKELGFSLKEIRELLSLKIADVEAKIRTLESMKRTLLKLAKSCGGCGPIADCPILDTLDREDA